MEAEEILFTKEQLKDAKKFEGIRDLLEGLLEEDGRYTIPEAEGMVENFMRGTVI